MLLFIFSGAAITIPKIIALCSVARTLSSAGKNSRFHVNDRKTGQKFNGAPCAIRSFMEESDRRSGAIKISREVME
jgi:hypothetical protein